MAIISTKITKSQLDALVAGNLLNEGLQYKIVNKKNVILLATSSNTYKILQACDSIEFNLLHESSGEILAILPEQYFDQTITVVKDAPNKRWVVTKIPAFETTDKKNIVQITNGNDTISSIPLFISGSIGLNGNNAGVLNIYITDSSGTFRGDDILLLRSLHVSVHTY